MYTEIIDDVYDITCRELEGRRYRVYLFTQDVATLIDAGFADTADVIIDACDALDITPERLIITENPRRKPRPSGRG